MNQIFDDREKAFERQFELDEEKNFRIVSHATVALGQWAADKLGLNETESRSYVQDVLQADLETPHHIKLLSKIDEDLVAKGVRVTPRDIGKQYDAFLKEYRARMMETEVE